MTQQSLTPLSAEISRHPLEAALDAAGAAGHDPTGQTDRQREQRNPAAPTADAGSGRPKKTAMSKKHAAPRLTNAASDSSPKVSKSEAALKLLRRKNGATLSELQAATGWQAHSVRGFLSGMVKKKLGLNLTSEAGKQGVRRYRVTAAEGG